MPEINSEQPLSSVELEIIGYIADIRDRARIEEIPAHLDWSSLKASTTPRRSSMRVL